MAKAKEKLHKKTEAETFARLPCRGCTRRCKNYDRCEGKPWRLYEKRK